MKYQLELLRLVSVILITFRHTRHSIDSGIVWVILEIIPTFGTFILSIISGYLYWEISRNRKNILKNKTNTLLIPYLIANSLVVLLALILYYFFDYNILNRLEINYKLITEGILSLNSPPINPPTYFIRNLFVIFVFIAFIKERNFKLLLLIIPLAMFGELFVRYEIPIMFLVGILISHFDEFISKYKKYFIAFFIISSVVLGFVAFDYFRVVSPVLIFLLVYKLNIRFWNVGGFTYILHLYHAPVMVAVYPIICIFVVNDYLTVPLQIFLGFLFSYTLYLMTRKINFLKILSGGR